MQQIEIFNIPSPCRNICQTDKRGYCLGCLRSRDERFYWNQLSGTDKLKVLKLCKMRRKRRIDKGEKLPTSQEHAEESVNPQKDMF